MSKTIRISEDNIADKKSKKQQLIDYANNLKLDEGININDVSNNLNVTVRYLKTVGKEEGLIINVIENGMKVQCICNPETVKKYSW